MDNRFTVFGVGLVSITISYGVFLIGWAIAFSLVAESNSITSWIPAFLGLPILFGGAMTLLRPEQIKIWMHISMLFGLLTLIGGSSFSSMAFLIDGIPTNNVMSNRGDGEAAVAERQTKT